jgi:nudix-type nucleoside diphosphatase (YffH/AdpP family)
MTDIFVYGTLCHAPLARLIAGEKVDLVPASLSGHAVFWAAGQSYPLMLGLDGAVAQGQLLTGLSDVARARLDFYEAAFGYYLAKVTVQTASGPQEALCYFPEAVNDTPGAPWDLDAWQATWAQISLYAAEEVMQSFGLVDPLTIGQRFPAIRMRAASRVTAEAYPSALTPSGMTQAQVITHRRHTPYTNWFSVLEEDLSFAKHEGGQSPVVNRATFMSGDSVLILPYDPKRDRVLLIEQFRAGPHFRGDPHPWTLEPVAGRIDPGETPEQAARREAVEEARLDLQAMHSAGRGYPSPGCSSEHYNFFVGIADLPDEIVGVAGEEAEAEDIRSHLFDFTTFMQMIDNDRISAYPTCHLGLWLARARDRLRLAA